MQLGTGILLMSLLHPIDVAEEAATLDVLCNGRFILGVGAAYGRSWIISASTAAPEASASRRWSRSFARCGGANHSTTRVASSS